MAPKKSAIRAYGQGRLRPAVRRGVETRKLVPAARRAAPVAEPTVCERCGVVYRRKTWRGGDRAVRTSLSGVTWHVCPACRQAREGEYLGRVSIAGPIALRREREIRRRIRNVDARARFTQPERRVLAVMRSGPALEVLTTSQKLAHRIARELRKAYGGSTRFEWADRDGVLRAWWSPKETPPPEGAATARARAPLPSPDLEIQTRRVALDPAWRDLIEEGVGDVVERHPQILRTHVTLARSAHQKKGRDGVSIVANAAGRVIRVEKRKETMAAALRAALAAFARAAGGLRRPKRALRPRRGRDVVPAQPAMLEVSR